MRALLPVLLLLAGCGYSHVLDTPVYAPGDMPPNLAAYELADEPDYDRAKLTTMRVLSPGGQCSGTAIGHHKVLTAKHCVSGDTGFVLGDRTAVITNIEFDDHDAAILTTDLYFTHYARFGPKPKQGDVVFSNANPAGTRDTLLIGRVAGWVPSYFGAKDTMLLDRNDWYGCSGAAVFDTEGRIVGVVNAIYPWPNKGWRLTAVFPLTFTAEQLAP